LRNGDIAAIMVDLNKKIELAAQSVPQDTK